MRRAALEFRLMELPPTAGLPLQLSDFSSALFSKYSAEKSFEKALAEILQADALDIYSSGTLCLRIAFETIKELSGRTKVIIPAYTCPLVPIAAHAAKMEVLLCDTKAGGFDFDLSNLEKLCDKSIAAIVPTNIAGLPADLKKPKELARAFGAYLIEDAAQSLGARRFDFEHADITVYSLAAGKGLSLYDGGILHCRDAELRVKSRLIGARFTRADAFLSLRRSLEIFGLWLFYNPQGLKFVYGNSLRSHLKQGDLLKAVGEDFELDIPAYEFGEFRKRIGLSALRRFPEFLSKNRLRALFRKKVLEEQFALDVLSEEEGTEGSWPFLMLLCKTQSDRDKIMDCLWGSGLGITRLFIQELPAYEYLRAIVPQVSMPNARDFAQRSFSITNSAFLREDMFRQILSSLIDLGLGRSDNQKMTTASES
ncbi:MAG: aminotransferase class I/II-fold pyridoxal phosphate-dependent enzyme [Candidatus Obscuribacterales bacterium]|nr:aminotransferase class I/II-fold pyridoxal phosphate-dependent enzyme [Candidatus Obscuribacterales bacterium]